MAPLSYGLLKERTEGFILFNYWPKVMGTYWEES